MSDSTSRTNLLTEIKRDPKALSLLKAKCCWEHMTLLAVLVAWGRSTNMEGLYQGQGR